MADIQRLNEWALQGRHPVSKVSLRCLGSLLDNYVLLPSGCALGRGCGPKIISREPLALADLAGKRIAIPGRDTTADLLFRLLVDLPFESVFCTYEQISELLNSGAADAGIIVHETRFIFQKQGFVEVADLGALWEERYALPVPLGGIVAKRELGQQLLEKLALIIRDSLAYARRHPLASSGYVQTHSQEKDPHIVRQHIDLYVTEETAWLSELGRASIEKMLTLARERHLLPPSNKPWLLETQHSMVHR